MDAKKEEERLMMWGKNINQNRELGVGFKYKKKGGGNIVSARTKKKKREFFLDV